MPASKQIRVCKKENCNEKTYYKGLCFSHSEIHRDKCKMENCNCGIYKDGLCIIHFREQNKNLKHCKVKNCKRLKKENGYCRFHNAYVNANGESAVELKKWAISN